MEWKCFFVGLAFASAVPAMSYSLIANGDFESGSLAPWSQTVDYGGPENWNVTNTGAHTGLYAATNRGNKEIRQNFAPTFGWHISTFTFALRNMDPSINAVTFYYDDGSSTELILQPGHTDWQVYDALTHVDIFGRKLNRGKYLAGFGVYGVSSIWTERTYLDDVQIEAVPEPATLAILSAGAVGLLRRRKRA